MTRWHVGFGCSITRVEKCTEMQVGSVLPSLQTATLPFQKELDTKEGIQINQESVEQSLLLPSLREKKKINPP